MSKTQKLSLAAVLTFLFMIAAVASILFFFRVIEPPAVFQAIIDSIGLFAAVFPAFVVATISTFAFGRFVYKIYRTRAELQLLQSQLNSFASSVNNQSDSTQQEKYIKIILLDLLEKFSNNKEIKSLLMSKRDDLISFSVRERDMELLSFLLKNCYAGQSKKASKLNTMFKIALSRAINYFSDIKKVVKTKDELNEKNQDLTSDNNDEQKTNDKSAEDLKARGDTLFLLKFIDRLGESFKLDPSDNLNKVNAWAKKENNIDLYMRVLRITKGTNVFQFLTEEYEKKDSRSFILDCFYSYTKNIKKEKANCSSKLKSKAAKENSKKKEALWLKFIAANENLKKIEEFLNKELENALELEKALKIVHILNTNNKDYILNKLKEAEGQKNEFLCKFYGYNCGGYIQRINKINDFNKQKEDFNKILQHIKTMEEFDDLMNNFKYDLKHTRGKILDFENRNKLREELYNVALEKNLQTIAGMSNQELENALEWENALKIVRILNINNKDYILKKLEEAEGKKNEFLCKFYGYNCGGYIQRINKINDFNKRKEDFNKILQHIKIETIEEFDDLMNNFKYDLSHTRGEIPDFENRNELREELYKEAKKHFSNKPKIIEDIEYKLSQFLREKDKDHIEESANNYSQPLPSDVIANTNPELIYSIDDYKLKFGTGILKKTIPDGEISKRLEYLKKLYNSGSVDENLNLKFVKKELSRLCKIYDNINKIMVKDYPALYVISFSIEGYNSKFGTGILKRTITDKEISNRLVYLQQLYDWGYEYEDENKIREFVKDELSKLLKIDNNINKIINEYYPALCVISLEIDNTSPSEPKP